jgi:hypothetical protein
LATRDRPYLVLPPGRRVLLAPGFEDVWFDECLLRRDFVPLESSTPDHRNAADDPA